MVLNIFAQIYSLLQPRIQLSRRDDGRARDDECPFLNQSQQRTSRFFECNVCDYKTKYKHHFNSHQYNHKQKTKCSICGKMVQNPESHYQRVHKFGKVPCKIGAKSISKINMKLHVDQVHKKNPELSCDICGSILKHRMSLYEHMRDMHLKVKSFSCNKCEYKTTRLSSLLQHQKVHSEKKEECQICHAHVKYLKEHIRNKHK